MAGIESVKDLVKPPFANYDIVVYFGCGLFALPFMLHYGEIFLTEHHNTKSSLITKLSKIDPAFSDQFVVSLIASLTVLVSVYILGQIIAYLGSEFIEKLMDSLFGKASSTVLRGSTDRRGQFKEKIVERINAGAYEHYRGPSWLSSVVRISYHFPVFLAYYLVYRYEVFGYHRTRVSEKVMIAAQNKFAVDNMADIKLDMGHEWFKALEAIVANNNPLATTRMYNYLIISGLFRSICFILLTASWFELAYTISIMLAGNPPSGLLMFGHEGRIAHLASYAAICALYLFCLFSYFKFQRRYVEDAIFAFVFTKEADAAGKLAPASTRD
ncbi:hypothetical protein [Sphingomonas melonis]|uniref:Uncharacterized protein n=1 Tax=Sphingomonas melonis TaxID=152682 RepID=A0A7Y9FKC6_9SPHN|nr:hypothetical protein [Sphingomonas melonis]NYD88860.1 hypothetical protein [Sphingomonas melonis]